MGLFPLFCVFLAPQMMFVSKIHIYPKVGQLLNFDLTGTNIWKYTYIFHRKLLKGPFLFVNWSKKGYRCFHKNNMGES